MKTLRLVISYLTFISLLLILTQCGSDNDDTTPAVPTGRSQIFNVISTNLSTINGTATFIENDNNSTTINLQLNNMQSGRAHPIFIRRNVAAEGGGIALDLGSIDANTGVSSINVNKLTDGRSISYEELINFNGYLGIDDSNQNASGLIAYSDIGPNALTGQQIVYGIVPVNNSGISGGITFAERANGSILVEIGLNDVVSNTEYPVDIHLGSLGEDSEAIIILSSLLSENNGTSLSQVRTDVNGDIITYTDLINLDAHVQIHPSPSDLNATIAQAPIGINEDATFL